MLIIWEDTFLYGYPQGRKKRFRSAQEFFPHFLWLMEGKSEDYGDCACKNCAGEWVHKIEPLPGRGGFVPLGKDFPSVKKDIVPIKKDSTYTKKEAPAASPKVMVSQKLPQQGTNLPRPPAKTPTPIPAPGPGRPPVQQMMSTPLPPPRSKEQELDSQYRTYIYRIGELVWFNRGTAWGLALIVKRDRVKESQQQGAFRTRFLVQPLSHPHGHPEPKLMTSDEAIRPWLAWSAPGPTHRSLVGRNYSSIDWKAVLAGQYGQGDAEVDGSILAAKQIDESFSLLSPLANNTLTTGERTYSTLFLGGEKLYVGEPVRLRINQGQDIMVIHEIIEKLKPNSTNINLASVHVVGDLYRLTTVPYDPANAKNINNPHLPSRMKADLEFRNNVTTPTKRLHSFWRLMQASARLTIGDLKGRWYESSTLLPTLRTNPIFAADIQRGDISDVGDWINGRGDANGAAGKTGTRYRERLEAVGRAVPVGMQLGAPDDSGEGGIEPGLPDASSSAQTGANSRESVTLSPLQTSPPQAAPVHRQGQGANSGEGDLSHYMDIDRLEE